MTGASPAAAAAGPVASMDLDALRYGNSPFGGKTGFDPHPSSKGKERVLAAFGSAEPGDGLLGEPCWADASANAFLGAVKEQRSILFRQAPAGPSGPSTLAGPSASSPAGLNAARTPSPGPGPRPWGRGSSRGRVGGRGDFPRGGRSLPGRGWPQRPQVFRSNSAEAAPRTNTSSTFQTGGATAFTTAPLEEVSRPQPVVQCFYCGGVGHYFRDCEQAKTQWLEKPLPARRFQEPSSTVAAVSSPAGPSKMSPGSGGK